jgi:hypothetical protein
MAARTGKEGEMSDPLSRFESVVDQQIRAAQERGDFDDLPGKGKPLPGWGRQDDDLWWLRQYMHREGLAADALLPASLQLAREVERLPEKVAKLASEQTVREAVAELNERIVAHLRMPSGPHVPLTTVDADEVVAQWRDARAAGPASAAADEAAPAPVAARSGRLRRWLGRRH